MSDKPPTTLWLGMRKGEWPVCAFTSQHLARHYLEEDPLRHRVWKVSVGHMTELTLVKPEPYLTEKDPITPELCGEVSS